MSGRRRLTAAGALAAALLAVSSAPPPARAHAVLVRSIPASRAVLGEPPDRVQLWFNERIEAAFSSVSVWSEAGAQVDRRDMAVDPDDAKHVAVTVKALAPGRYVVRFRVLSVDGHIVQASFAFTVKPRS